MFSDSSVINPSEDKFCRLPFAKRVAEAIASHQDPSSMVIGIYGAWGEGKTTVLNFIEKCLDNKENIICVKLNPWLFPSEESLLISFFALLADTLDKPLKTKTEKFGEIINQYGELLSVLPKVGKEIKELGENLSSVSLEELKTRVGQFLKETEKRIVIFMDDIDRLDKAEIQSVFKLVKLSAGFNYTTYVLAFDEEMVATALGEKYGTGNPEAGRKFLEKIVQLPLQLPKVNTLSLRRFCFNYVDTALREAGVEITEEQELRFFGKSFIEGFEIQLNTPRMVKRYVNTLTFSLSILKDEVCPVDLMLIEGVRVFYPQLYEIIKNNSDCFLGIKTYQQNQEQAKEQILQIITPGLESLNHEAQESAKKILLSLFPTLRGILGGIPYSGWGNSYFQEKRIASRAYFNRYFSYAILENDVSDLQLESFLENVQRESISQISSKLQNLINKDNADIFLTKIRQKTIDLPSEALGNLCQAIALNGDLFPNPDTLEFLTSFHQVAMMVSDWIRNHPQRFELAKSIIDKGKPLVFSSECYRWMQSKKSQGEPSVFSEEEKAELAQILVKRIKKLAEEKTLYLQFPQEAKQLIGDWSYYSSSKETTRYLHKSFQKKPQQVINFLECYLPKAWSLTTGLPFKKALEKEEYDAIVKDVDGKVVANALFKIYGSDLFFHVLYQIYGLERFTFSMIIQLLNSVLKENILYSLWKKLGLHSPEWDENENISKSKIIAYQFIQMYIYREVLK